MERLPNLIPECFADTLLVEMLLRRRPNHKSGIGQVSNLFESDKKGTSRLVGIIDADRSQPSFFKKHFKIEDEKHGLALQKSDLSERHFLIVVQPAFEKWVFENADAVQTDPGRFGFSSEKAFRIAAKDQNVSKNQRFRAFLESLNQKNAPGFRTLQTWIEEKLAL